VNSDGEEVGKFAGRGIFFGHGLAAKCIPAWKRGH
jgi:hypothetical protein